jgi:hypothetical protein
MKNFFINLVLLVVCVPVFAFDLGSALNAQNSRSSIGLNGEVRLSREWEVQQPMLIGRGPNGEELDANGNVYPDSDDDDAYEDDDDEEEGAIDDDEPGLLGVKMPVYPEPIPLGEKEALERGCNMNPPFIYVNFHTGPNIAKYTTDGCYLGKDILYTEPEGIPSRGVEFRSMIIAPFEEHEHAMYIANAAKRGSQVMVYSPCGIKSSKTDAGITSIKSYQRDLLHIVTAKHPPKRNGRERHFRKTYKRNRGANHCFGIAVNRVPTVQNMSTHDMLNVDHTAQAAGVVPSTGTGQLFASFQHTNVVLWFDAETLQEKGLPRSLVEDQETSRKPYYPGTFHQFNYPNGGRMPMGQRHEGIRALEAVTGADGSRKLWVANEGISAIVIFNIDTGVSESMIQIECPIAMFHFKRELIGGDDRVYIGSSTTHSDIKPRPPGRIYAINPRTLRIEDEYSMPQWVHPVGMFADGQKLYVAEQILGAVYSIDLVTGKGEQILERKDLPMEGVIEGMVGSPC